MMIKCSKCGYENQLGSIFCRGCGEKIDTSALDPQANGKVPGVEMADGKKKKKKGFGTFSLILLLILAGLIALVVLILSPGDAPEYTKPANNYAQAVRNLERNRNTTLTPEQMTAWFDNEVLAKGVASAEGITLKYVLFTGDDELLKVYIGTEICTRPVVFTLTGTLTKGSAENPVSFNIQRAKIGMINIPESMLPKVTERIEPLTKIQAVKDAFTAAKTVRFSQNRLSFGFGK